MVYMYRSGETYRFHLASHLRKFHIKQCISMVLTFDFKKNLCLHCVRNRDFSDGGFLRF